MHVQERLQNNACGLSQAQPRVDDCCQCYQAIPLYHLHAEHNWLNMLGPLSCHAAPPVEESACTLKGPALCPNVLLMKTDTIASHILGQMFQPLLSQLLPMDRKT